MRLGKVREKITIGGMDVHNNDLLLADENGVVVVLEQKLKLVIAACEYGVKHNKMVRQAIESGATTDEAFLHARTILGKDANDNIAPLRR